MTCWTPFIELRQNISLYSTCCIAWLDPKAFIGLWGRPYADIYPLTPWGIWNHPVFQKVRTAILSGDYDTHCRTCARITAGHVEKQVAEPWMKPVMELPPKRIWLEHDRLCNLQCPSCRCSLVTKENNDPEQVLRDNKAREICSEFLPTAEELVVMTSGEPLLSPSTLEILAGCYRYPQLKIELYTNATLLLRRWDTLPQGQIYKFNISIDAGSKEVYEKVRPPAKWEHIQETLKFVSTLGRFVQLNFVVQEANFTDIPAFIKMCKDLGVHVAHLASILQVWHPQDLYDSMNICDPKHPRHMELLKVLEDPLLRDPITLCPTLYHLMK